MNYEIEEQGQLLATWVFFKEQKVRMLRILTPDGPEWYEPMLSAEQQLEGMYFRQDQQELEQAWIKTLP